MFGGPEQFKRSKTNSRPIRLDLNLVFSARKPKALIQVISSQLLVGLEPALASIPHAKHIQPLKSLSASPRLFLAILTLAAATTTNPDLLVEEANTEELRRAATLLPRELVLVLCSSH